MEITDKLIEHLEALAHIELSSEERADCRRDFEKIITYMDTLSALDTEDEPGETLGSGEALCNACETADGCFSVPKTVE